MSTLFKEWAFEWLQPYAFGQNNLEMKFGEKTFEVISQI